MVITWYHLLLSKIEHPKSAQCYEKHLSNIRITGLRFLGNKTLTRHRGTAVTGMDLGCEILEKGNLD